jgi:tetratricopeptide (TPR) repeat protein
MQTEAEITALSHVQRGRELRGRGQLTEAEAAYRAALDVSPQCQDAHNCLGILLCVIGRTDDAEAAFREAIRLGADMPETHNNLGVLLWQRGLLEQAETSYREAIRRRSEYPEAHNNLGIVLTNRHLWDEAEASYRQALRLQPAYAEARNRLAHLLWERGRLGEAELVFRDLVRLQPHDAEVHNDLGGLLRERGRLTEAEAALDNALRLRPNYPEAYNNLGTLLRERGELIKAEAALRDALRLQPTFPEAYYNLALVIREQDQLNQAEVSFHDALRQKPEYPNALAGLAEILTAQGRRDEAVSHYREAIRIQPDYTLSYFKLGELAAQGQYTFTTDETEKMQALLATGGLSAEHGAHLHFALAAMLDKRGLHDEAFGHYDRANELQKEVFRQRNRAFDPKRHRAFVDELIATFTPEFFERARSFGLDTEVPVFVVGMPRSGTTLVEQILASHPRVFGAGELSDVPAIVKSLAQLLGSPEQYPVCLERIDSGRTIALAERHVQRLHALGGSALRVVDKLPSNFLHLGLIALLFPRAHVIHCRRDTLDVCVSCYFQHFLDMPFASSLEDIGYYYRQYERLVRHWRDVLPLRVHEVVYEDLVANQEAMSRSLIDFLGLDWDERCLAFHKNQQAVRTASHLQVRRPIYTSSVQRWKRYEKHLQPLLAALHESDPTNSAETAVVRGVTDLHSICTET